jgi:hypothetical protein
MPVTADRASALWAGMILAGVALLVAVWLAWPDPTVRLVRLPYGESAPKTPLVERAPVAATPVVPATVVADAPVVAEEDEGGVLAEVERAPAAAVAPQPDVGPEPEPTQEEAELLPQESAEELGAEPLPGTVSSSREPASGEG